MRPFHLLIHDAEARAPRRIDFQAESPDHAFQVARNECDGIHVELWDEHTLLARMTKAGGLWQLLPVGKAMPERASGSMVEVPATAMSAMRPA